MRRILNRVFTGALALATLVAPAGATAVPQHTAAVDQLIRQGVGHDADGDYEAAAATWQQLGELAPDHPGAHVHATDTMYWLQVFEDDDESYDEEILRESLAGVSKSEAWVEEKPSAGRAHLYLGQSLINLGRLHGIRGRLYKAGSLGERGREHLERALELDPTLRDAAYPLGLYAYYASQVPRLFQWMSFLWFVPKGNAQQGLSYLDEVRQRADYYRFTGAFHLANIRTYHSMQDRALSLAITRDLHEQHPSNSLVHFELIEVLMLERDYEAVVIEARALEGHPGQARHHRGRANVARIWRARAELHLGRPRPAWEILETFGAEGPEVPGWGHRWVAVTRGQILDVQGERDAAIAQYRLVASPESSHTGRSAQAARAGLKAPFALGEPASIR
jgi:tetratricopeptide (TPR) repeat protein